MRDKNIIISKNPDYILWDEDISDIPRNTLVNVEEGCIALYIVNGLLKSTLSPGRWEIKSKEEDKNNSLLKLICANTDKTFDICCGASGVPFRDFELDAETTVGAHGECKVRLVQPWALYSTMGKANISVEDVSDYAGPKLREMMCTSLSVLLQSYDYSSMTTQQTAIADKLQKQFADEFINIGLQIVSFSLGGFKFSDEYLEKRKQSLELKNKKIQEREERRQKEKEEYMKFEQEKALKALEVQGIQAANSTPATTQVNSNPNQAAKFCPNCGKKCDAQDNFCSSCGSKLK